MTLRILDTFLIFNMTSEILFPLQIFRDYSICRKLLNGEVEIELREMGCIFGISYYNGLFILLNLFFFSFLKNYTYLLTVETHI